MAYASWSVVFGEQPTASKWNILGTNDAHFYDFLGDDLAWQSWTPSWTNFTPGSATVTAKYTRVGNTVFFRLYVSLDSSTMGSNPQFSLPVTSIAYPDTTYQIGTATLFVSGVTNGWVSYQSTTVAALFRWDANNDNGSITSSLPASWGNGSKIKAQGFYEAA